MLKDYLNEKQIGKLATISGRYYSMDRERMWDKTKKCYDALVNGEAPIITNYETVLEENYKKGIYDEFIPPTIINKEGQITDNDSIIVANFRPDRLTQLFSAITNPRFRHFETKKLNNLKELEKLNIKINDAIDNDDYLYNYNSDRIKNIFHSRIEELKKEYKVNIIEVDNYEINQLLYRYIEKKAPFDNNKNSWQDCLVWSSYEKIINKTDDKYYIFIVNDKKA